MNAPACGCTGRPYTLADAAADMHRADVRRALEAVREAIEVAPLPFEDRLADDLDRAFRLGRYAALERLAWAACARARAEDEPGLEYDLDTLAGRAGRALRHFTRGA